MRELWWNDYVGLPYKKQGRAIDGLDCWGLVRVVYEKELGIDLPSFADVDGRDMEAETFARYKESWHKADLPQSGDVVLLRILGEETHVGLVTQPGYFLHVRSGQDSAIECLDSFKWKNRVAGIYRYSGEGMPLTVAARPHPLRTERIDLALPSGLSLAQMSRAIRMSAGVSADYPDTASIAVDGEYIPHELWDTTFPVPGSRVEYRAVPGDSAIGRLIGMIAIAVFAWWAAPYILGAMSIAATPMALGITQMVISTVGMMLLNSLFPVRQPDAAPTPESMNLLKGGQNRAQPYGAIPVVLGRVRFTPPVAGTTYAESNARIAYLRMCLLWGYGPVVVSDLRIGETPLTSYQEVESMTITGWEDTAEVLTDFNRIYGRDVCQYQPGVELVNPGGTNPALWHTHVLTDEIDQITVTIHFPEGCYQTVLEGGNAGDIGEAPVRLPLQCRQLDSVTLVPITAFADVNVTIYERWFSVNPAWYNVDTDEELEPVYRWTRVSLSERNQFIFRDGAVSTSPSANPTGLLLERLQAENTGFNVTYNLWPDYGPGEEALWDVCVYGDTIYQVIDRRDGSITGCALSYTSPWDLYIASGTVTRGTADVIMIGGPGEPYYKYRDAFTYNYTFNVPRGRHEVRIRLATNSDETFYFPSGNEGRRMNDTILTTITGYRNSRPVIPPKNTKLAMTAIRIRASDQLNGTVDGITGTVTSICLDYDHVGLTWVKRATRNPASLFRYVLQHPANAKKCADAKIDLVKLAEWHTFCRTRAFTFDHVCESQRSLLEVLKDICAAGRASPTMVDGKWTVVIDTVRTSYAQHFTPHNSWGFEGVRSLPIIPHAFRVPFVNSNRAYEPDELIVYNDGYSSTNATLFETIHMPGVTTSRHIYRLARFHFAQIKLRPETYTLNADMEHLVCTRGDLVKVTHDVPMWGLGSGRVKERVSDTNVILGEPVPMDAGVTYTIRFRLADGSSITRTVAAKPTDGHYVNIVLTTALPANQPAPLDLFMFGALSSEAVDCLVLSVEPSENMTARVTLVDYSPAVFNSENEVIPDFDSQITKPPLLLQEKPTTSPTVTQVVSDETVMVRIAPGVFEYKIKVSFTNSANLPVSVSHVQGELDYANDNVVVWANASEARVGSGSLMFNDVREGQPYRIRLRYMTKDGIAGPWSAVTQHTVVGRTRPPMAVTALPVTISGLKVVLKWTVAPEIDVMGYEVRTSDAGWGDENYLFKGNVTTTMVDPGAVGVATTWYVKPYDSLGLYSTTAASMSYTRVAPVDVSVVNVTFQDTSVTNATVTIDWDDVKPLFGLKDYEITFDAKTYYVAASSITLPANWVGNKTYTIKVRDLLDAKSSGYGKTITKYAPDYPLNFRAQVVDNNVLLFWTLPAKTSLPVSHVNLYKGATFSGATFIGRKDGAFTSFSEMASGNYTYWITAVDTDGIESIPVGIIVKVAEPPDFVFHFGATSTLNGTKTNAITDNGTIILPVNTTQTFATHFTDNGWTTPDQQIAAGFPYFLQPTPASGSYVETFDVTQVLNSSQVVISYTGSTIAGTPTVTPKIELSPDNTNWTVYDNTSAAFGTNFRYIRFTLTIGSSDNKALYRLETLTCTVAAKLINDAGTTSCLAADTNGTIANFNKKIVDVSSITVSPNSTVLRTAVFDYQDAQLSGTYSVTSNVVTVNVTAHGLEVGQKVTLMPSTGTMPEVVVTVATKTANSFTASVTTANVGTSNLKIYPQGMRIYLFNSAGTRVDGSVSWAIKGY